jgi:hypothetical protein
MPVPTFTTSLTEPEGVSRNVRCAPPAWSWNAQSFAVTADWPVQAAQAVKTSASQARPLRMTQSILSLGRSCQNLK